ncbi:MAG TPA: response regulator [Candidatus Binataceae bacterium]|nr:response regulator [Candidatus Binataceae bacterium]
MPEGTIKVLLIEDNPGDARLVEIALSESPSDRFELSIASRLSHGIEILARSRIDIVLLDLSLPDCLPQETVSRIAAAAPHLPIVVLTGYEDERFSREVVRLGAQDYLVKGQFDSRLLARALYYAIERKRSREELARARDAAVEAAGHEARFLANMSHEIRTPMNAVIGMTRMLLDTPLDPDQREFAEAVWNSAHALLGVIDDILEISKVSSGKTTLRESEFSPTAVVESVIELFAERIQNSEIQLASLVDGDVPAALRGDPGRLRQVLINLVGNAAKFTVHGEISLAVRKHSETQDAVMLHFTVADTGPGIPIEAQQKLFAPFYQADNSMTRRHGGTGLGLAISAQIVELMGGQIGVESTLGHGATFWFTAAFERAPGKFQTEGQLRRLLWGTRVMVADPAAVSARFLRRQLTGWGLECDSVLTGEEALATLARTTSDGNPYRLVVADSQLATADDYELTRAIRDDPRYGSPKMVVAYLLGHRPDEEAMRKAGISAWFPKPVRQSQLYDRLASALAGQLQSHHEFDLARSKPGALDITSRQIPQSIRQHAKVLLAEDHPVNERVVMRMLKRLGFFADAVHNGREVLSAVSAQGYDLILMDCQMPEMDGYQATREIRAQSLEHQPVIVALTAHALESDREKCIAAGMDDYLSKPVQPEDLARVITKWLAKPAAETDHPAIDSQPPIAGQEDDESPIDPAAISKLGDPDDDSFALQMIDVFLNDLQQRLATIREAFANRDSAALAQVTHTLKGSCSHFGGRRLMRICAEVERASRAGAVEGLGERIEELLREAARVSAALEVHRAPQARAS